jgi:beta-galactosidase/beta-glucuronidase
MCQLPYQKLRNISFSDKELNALHGKQVYKLPVKLKDPKVWNPDSPYLYQLQVTLKSDDKVFDNKACQFGMRSFTQDTI